MISWLGYLPILCFLLSPSSVFGEGGTGVLNPPTGMRTRGFVGVSPGGPSASASNTSFDEVRRRLTLLFSDATGVSPNSFRIQIDFADPPETLCAINTTPMQKAQAAMANNANQPGSTDTRPIVIISEKLWETVENDQELKQVFRHEWAHQVIHKRSSFEYERKVKENAKSNSPDIEDRWLKTGFVMLDRLALSQENEFGADHIAMRESIKKGENPQALINLLRRFAKKEEGQSRRLSDSMDRSHPFSDRRIDGLEGYLRSEIDKGDLSREVLARPFSNSEIRALQAETSKPNFIAAAIEDFRQRFRKAFEEEILDKAKKGELPHYSEWRRLENFPLPAQNDARGQATTLRETMVADAKNEGYKESLDYLTHLISSAHSPTEITEAGNAVSMSRFDDNPPPTGSTHAKRIKQLKDELERKTEIAIIESYDLAEHSPLEAKQRLDALHKGHYNVINKAVENLFSEGKIKPSSVLALNRVSAQPMSLVQQSLKEEPLLALSHLDTLQEKPGGDQNPIVLRTEILEAAKEISAEQIASLPNKTLWRMLLGAAKMNLESPLVAEGARILRQRPDASSQIPNEFLPDELTLIWDKNSVLRDLLGSYFDKRLENYRQHILSEGRVPLFPNSREWHENLILSLSASSEFKGNPVVLELWDKLKSNLKAREEKLLSLPAADFEKTISEAISAIDKQLGAEKRKHTNRKGLESSLAQEVARYRGSGASHKLPAAAMDALLMLRYQDFPELNRRIDQHKAPIVRRLFAGERPTPGASTLVRRFLKTLTPGQQDQVLADAIRNSSEPFDMAQYSWLFDRDLTLERAFALTSDPVEKIRLAARFRVKIHRPEEAQRIYSVLEMLGNELAHGKREYSSYKEAFEDAHMVLADWAPYHTTEKQRLIGMEEKGTQSYVDQIIASAVPRNEKIRTLSKMAFTEFGTTDQGHVTKNKKQVASDRVKTTIVQPALLTLNPSILERYEFFRRDDSDNFRSAEYLSDLQRDLLADRSLPLEKRLRMHERLAHYLSPRQMENAWRSFFPEVEKGSKYQEAALSELLRSVYGTYSDGKNRRLETVFQHYHLNRDQMKKLRTSVFPEAEQAQSYRTAKLVAMSLDGHLGLPQESAELLRWLQGKTKTIPPLAIKVIADVRSHGVNNFNAERFLDIYQNGDALLRWGLVTPILSSNNSRGLLHPENTDGRKLFLDVLLEGMGETKSPLLRFFLRNYFDSLGGEAHTFAAQMIAGLGRSDAADGRTDYERIAEFLGTRGSLWVKLSQQASIDPALVPDPALRKVLSILKDKAPTPGWEKIYDDLKEVLGDAFFEIDHVEEAKKAGSVNIGLKVVMKSGQRKFIRYTRGEVGTQAANELEVLQRFLQLIRDNAPKELSEADASKIGHLARFLEEYVPVLAKKVGDEGDLRRDTELAKLLKPAYTRKYSRLGVQVSLLDSDPLPEIQPNPRQSRPPRQPNPARVAVFEVIDDLSDTLTPEEHGRVRQAMWLTEWEALWQHGTFDPDGHEKNWLVIRLTSGELAILRIDYSQGTKLSAPELEGFRSVVASMFQEKNRLATLSYAAPNKSELFKHFKELTDIGGDTTAEEKAFAEAWDGVVRNKEKNPFVSLVDLKRGVESRLGRPVNFKDGIHLALKSVHIGQDLLSDSSPSNSRLQAETFSRLVLRKPPLVQKLMGAMSWLHAKWSPTPTAAEKVSHSAPDTRVDPIKSLLEKSLGTLYADRFRTLTEYYETYPEHRGRILEMFWEYLQQNVTPWRELGKQSSSNQEALEWVTDFLHRHDPEYGKKLLSKLSDEVQLGHKYGNKISSWNDRKPRLNSMAQFALEEILSRGMAQYYPDIAKFYLEYPQLGYLFRDSATLPNELRELIIKEIKAHALELGYDAISPLPPQIFREIFEDPIPFLSRSDGDYFYYWYLDAFAEAGLKNEEARDKILDHLIQSAKARGDRTSDYERLLKYAPSQGSRKWYEIWKEYLKKRQEQGSTGREIPSELVSKIASSIGNWRLRPEELEDVARKSPYPELSNAALAELTTVPGGLTRVEKIANESTHKDVKRRWNPGAILEGEETIKELFLDSEHFLIAVGFEDEPGTWRYFLETRRQGKPVDRLLLKLNAKLAYEVLFPIERSREPQFFPDKLVELLQRTTTFEGILYANEHYQRYGRDSILNGLQLVDLKFPLSRTDLETLLRFMKRNRPGTRFDFNQTVLMGLAIRIVRDQGFHPNDADLVEQIALQFRPDPDHGSTARKNMLSTLREKTAHSELTPLLNRWRHERILSHDLRSELGKHPLSAAEVNELEKFLIGRRGEDRRDFLAEYPVGDFLESLRWQNETEYNLFITQLKKWIDEYKDWFKDVPSVQRKKLSALADTPYSAVARETPETQIEQHQAPIRDHADILSRLRSGDTHSRLLALKSLSALDRIPDDVIYSVAHELSSGDSVIRAAAENIAEKIIRNPQQRALLASHLQRKGVVLLPQQLDSVTHVRHAFSNMGSKIRSCEEALANLADGLQRTDSARMKR
jgi:hypothetical protein